MTRTTLLQRGSISVTDFRCTAGPDDTPFVEQYASHSISYVRKGSFGCQHRGRFFELVAGSILVGYPGDEFCCTHDHVCGDECLSFFLTPETVEVIGDRTAAWQIGAAPPLPELMVLGELAQAAADGRSDIGLDEVGQVFAGRFVEVISGRREKPVSAKARDRRRAVESRATSRPQPVPFPAAVLKRARRDPAPISGAFAAAPCGAAFGRRSKLDYRHRL